MIRSSKPQQEHISAVMIPLPISDHCGSSLDGYTSESSSLNAGTGFHRSARVSKGKAAVKESYEMKPLGPKSKALDGRLKPSTAPIARDWAHQNDVAHPTRNSKMNAELDHKAGVASPDKGLQQSKLHPPILPRTTSLHFRDSRKGDASERSNSQPAPGLRKEAVHRPPLVRSRSELSPRTRALRDNQVHNMESSMSGVTIQRTPHLSFRSKRSSGFSLPRYQHKPVARNWRTSRKRITATIACVNTAFVGYIIGIYVSVDDFRD
jgi:hypothetical protein